MALDCDGSISAALFDVLVVNVERVAITAATTWITLFPASSNTLVLWFEAVEHVESFVVFVEVISLHFSKHFVAFADASSTGLWFVQALNIIADDVVLVAVAGPVVDCEARFSVLFDCALDALLVGAARGVEVVGWLAIGLGLHRGFVVDIAGCVIKDVGDIPNVTVAAVASNA